MEAKSHCESSIQPTSTSGGAEAWRRSAPPGATIILYRDTWGVPHIHAKREADGFYGLGYAIAQDNLEDVLRQHIIGRGEVARYFGPDYVEIDRQFALFDVHEEALAALVRLPPQLRENAEAYVEGINRYLEERPGERPLWAMELRPTITDLIGFSQFFTLMFPVNYMHGIGDCRRGGINIPSTYDLFINLLRTGGPADASTAWAVAPWRTAVNGTIHLADPHNLIDVPSPEFRIHAGDFEFCGFMMGLLFAGHSRHVAWGTTFGSPDVADCYSLKTDIDDPQAYRLDGQRFPIHSKVVRIPVKGSEPREVTIEHVVINGIRAPIVARRDRLAYAIATPYAERAEGSLVDLYNLARAKDIQGVRQALTNQGLFPVGLTVADSSGNIGYFRVGRTPKRDDGIDWARPVSGDESATQWRGGIHPFEDLLQVINPPQGYIRETNLPAASMWNGKNAFLPTAFPRYIMGDTPEINELASPVARGQRADDVLRRTFHLTDEQAQAYLFDETWPNVRRWQLALLEAAETETEQRRNLTEPERILLQRILHFDGNACAESIDALAYHYWQDGVSDAAQADRIALARRVRNGNPMSPVDKKLLLEGLRRAARLMSSLKHWNSKYGDVFRFGRGGETYPIGGCTTPFGATLHTTECGGHGTSLRLAVAGQKQVMLTIFGEPLRSYSLVAFGQQWRSRPKDPHLNDQSRLRSEHRLKPTLFERTQLLKQLESQLTLTRPAAD